MNLWLFVVVILISPPKCFQKCTNTLAVTECEDTVFTNLQPLTINPYRSFLAFKHDGNIQEIPAGTFRLLPDVTSLYINFNKVNKLQPGAFMGLTKLKVLSIVHNKIVTLPNGIFSDCGNLIELHLNGNEITAIGSEAFVQLINLKILDLSYNHLVQIPESLWVLRKLKKLNLAYNQIKSLTVVDGLNELEVLNLEGNRIRYIPDNTFGNLRQVKVINLKDNYLSNLNAANVLNNLKSLKTINLNLNAFGCSTLRNIIEEFKSKNVEVISGHSKSNTTVNGIRCIN